jgi:hypothetical protein
MRQHPGRIVFVVPACVGTTASCGAGDNAASRSAAIPRVVTPTATNPTSKPPKRSNDLKTGRNERVSRSGELTLNAEYSTPVRRSASGARKPLDVTLTAFVEGDREQKVYSATHSLTCSGSEHVKFLKSKWQFGGTKWRDSSYRTEALHGGSDASLGGGP